MNKTNIKGICHTAPNSAGPKPVPVTIECKQPKVIKQMELGL